MTPEEHILALLAEFGPLPASKLMRTFSRRARRAMWFKLDELVKTGRVGLDAERRLVAVKKGTVGR